LNPTYFSIIINFIELKINIIYYVRIISHVIINNNNNNNNMILNIQKAIK
jgi:hypothetical protein